MRRQSECVRHPHLFFLRSATCWFYSLSTVVTQNETKVHGMYWECKVLNAAQKRSSKLKYVILKSLIERKWFRRSGDVEHPLTVFRVDRFFVCVGMCDRTNESAACASHVPKPTGDDHKPQRLDNMGSEE